MKRKNKIVLCIFSIIIGILIIILIFRILSRNNEKGETEYILSDEEVESVEATPTEQLVNDIEEEIKSQNNEITTIDTVEEMKKIDFKIGEFVKTQGYYEVNDEGAGIYQIVEKNENSNGEELDNGLEAEIIVKNKINVHQFGAKGDGVTDDTKAIQKALDYGDVYIEFSKEKTYKVVALELKEGNKILGNQAILKRANLKSSEYEYSDGEINWNRLVSFDYYNEEGGNSKDTSIDGLIFDGSAFEMWSEEDEYKYQQASLLIVLANSEDNKEVHANINISNCQFINNYSDGIHIVQNVNAKIENCISQDCFRGGLVVTGGASNVECNKMKCVSTRVNDGVDIEIDSEGYDGSRKSNITITNMEIDDDLDIAVFDGSKFTGANIVMTKDTGSFNLENFDSEINIKDSKLYSNGTACYFKRGNTVLENIEFYAATDIQEDTQLLQLIDLGEGNTENYFEINKCKFYGLKDRNYMISGIGGGVVNGKIQVLECYFNPDINQHAIGGNVGATSFQVREILVKDCTFDNCGYACNIVKTQYIESSKWILSNMNITNEQNKGISKEWGKEAIIEYN